jgi:acyl-CoA synthetase (AMP-forming)/AMP-acid ligase II
MPSAEKLRSTAADAVGSTPVNIAERLMQTAARLPQQEAIITQRRSRRGSFRYDAISFEALASDVRRLSVGLQDLGVSSGQRMVLMVKPSIDFVALTFALFRVGAVTVLIDPGMGKDNLLDCLEAVRPDGFVAIPLAQAARVLHKSRFPKARLNVTVGRRWFWGGATINQLRRSDEHEAMSHRTDVDDPAAIIFTTGSTGPPKGVLYTHGNFEAQVDQIRDRYDITPGGVDLAGFPLFGLFNGAMGTTTVIPDMDASKPASVNPENIVHAIQELGCTQSFASPAVWNVVGRHCDEWGVELPTLQRVLSAGAPVPVDVIRRLKRTIHPQGEIYTPYGATESLPVASIAGGAVLRETGHATSEGAGTCVGSRFREIDWRVIEISDGPLKQIDETRQLERGQIGELIVSGPQVTSRYVTREEQNAYHKISDGDRFWHRLGDVGYLDDQDRFWFCGRKAHRVITKEGTMYTVRCEAIANGHRSIYRSALVGIGPDLAQIPVMICEPLKEAWPRTESQRQQLCDELFDKLQSHELTSTIQRKHVLLRQALPVDIRHNAKIFREKLAIWAGTQPFV